MFEEILSNHSDVVQGLKIAPFVKGVEKDSPAFEFAGRGVHISSSHLSDAVRHASCLVNEVTIYASAFFRDSQSSGPLLLISPTGEAGRTDPLWGVYMNAHTDELMVAYR